VLTVKIIDVFGHVMSETTETDPIEVRRHIDHWMLNSDDDVQYIEIPELRIRVSPSKLVGV